MGKIDTPVTPTGAHDSNGPAPQDDTAKTTNTKTSLSQATGIVPTTQSIWHKYVEVVDNWERGTMEKWRADMNNLLIFAALFTAIVTAFVLEALPDLKNLSTSNQPSSILTISGLWFGSIMSSLVATTWAITCLQWCTPKNVTEGEDYGELIAKKHRRVEAIHRWRMGFIVAAIPFFLYVSLFSFLAGLWLRLRDINKDIGLIVGVPTLLMAFIHAVVTFLPIFTDAPFTNSTSEVIEPVLRGIKNVAGYYRFIHPPPLFTLVSQGLRCAFTWILTRVLGGFRRVLDGLRPKLRLFTRALLFKLLSALLPQVAPFLAVQISYLNWISVPTPLQIIATPWIIPGRITIWLLSFVLPTYTPNPHPYHGLNELELERSDSNNRASLRALFWLMKVPLNREQTKGVLKEFQVLYSAAEREPMDHYTIKILVSSITFLLEDDEISRDDEAFLYQCLTLVAKQSDNGFRHREGFWRTWKSRPILTKLLPYFRLDDPFVPPTPSGEDATEPYPMVIEDNHWLRKVVPALLFCPLPETVKIVAGQLDQTEHLTKETLLPIIRGLHGTVLACSHSIIEEMPDLGIWSWDSQSLDRTLDRALVQFLQDLFENFRRNRSLATTPRPTTISSLVIDCLGIIDEDPGQYHPKVHSALCLLAVAAWRSDPLLFKGTPSLANCLLRSAEAYREFGSKDGFGHAMRRVTRLRAIACGPKPLICNNPHPLTLLGNVHSELLQSNIGDKQYLKGLLDAHAATLEAMLLIVDGLPAATLAQQPNTNPRPIRGNFLTNLFFTHHDPLDFVQTNPNWRLPYLYSLFIALTCKVGRWNEELFKVSELLVNRDENRVTLDRALDTNILVVAVLGYAAQNHPGDMRSKLGDGFVGRLKETIRDGTDWRTRWKSIYFIADLALLLSRIGMLERAEAQFLKKVTIEAFSRVKVFQRVPSDWRRKLGGLTECYLIIPVWFLSRIQGEAERGVYEWIDGHDVPYLALYHPLPTGPRRNLYPMNWWLSLFSKSNERPATHEELMYPAEGADPSIPQEQV